MNDPFNCKRILKSNDVKILFLTFLFAVHRHDREGDPGSLLEPHQGVGCSNPEGKSEQLMLPKGGLPKKPVFFGNFSQMADAPPHPPFGNPLVEKKF